MRATATRWSATAGTSRRAAASSPPVHRDRHAGRAHHPVHDAAVLELAGLPAALIITSEADVLRDEGEAYANRLRAAGVPVTAVRYLSIIHDFVKLNALRET
ncbi:alpha/beta hydrolase fold domain-containing protein [Streptosporangium album]|nr:alpha/beta hydrolase fold domain-containing protein [Streptosporangium album]